jgi:hypothetical protein
MLNKTLDLIKNRANLAHPIFCKVSYSILQRHSLRKIKELDYWIINPIKWMYLM